MINSNLKQHAHALLELALVVCLPASAPAAPGNVGFFPATKAVEVYDFLEIPIAVDRPDAANPFADVSVTGEFSREGGAPVKVNGFCDSDDGGVYRIRFMPSQPGDYSGMVRFQQGDFTASDKVEFSAWKGKRRGPVRVDREHPFHFVWEGTGEHYFWNSTTAYALIGWRDDAVIRESIDRLHRLKVNRIRAAIFPPRVKGAAEWYEPTVTNNAQFSFLTSPWPAARPDDVGDPGFDISRFNVAHWQKYERLVRHARERDMIVSAIFYVSGHLPGNYPFRKSPAGEAEKRYYRYAAARLGAFANVMWDLSNEYNLFRDNAWAEQMGAFLKKCDPYDHLTSVHHNGDGFNFRKSPWADFAMHQCWDERGGYAYMLRNRAEQVKTGRPMPQINEEYGYEDHYPEWEGNRKPPARSADNRRRLAWEMTMAEAYQTTGERANEPGYGGWANGRGNEAMVMLKGYAILRGFFEGFPWWRLEPLPDLIVSGEAFCLAEIGQRYLIYLPKGGAVKAKLGPGEYKARWFNPRAGKFGKTAKVAGGSPASFDAPDREDWALLVESEPL